MKIHNATGKRLLAAACISRALPHGVHAVQAGNPAASQPSRDGRVLSQMGSQCALGERLPHAHHSPDAILIQ